MTNIQWLCPESKTGRPLQQPALKMHFFMRLVLAAPASFFADDDFSRKLVRAAPANFFSATPRLRFQPGLQTEQVRGCRQGQKMSSGSSPPNACSWMCQERNRATRSLVKAGGGEERNVTRDGCEARRGRATAGGRSRPRSTRNQTLGEACRSRRVAARLAFAMRRDIVRHAVDARFASFLGEPQPLRISTHMVHDRIGAA